MRTLNINNGFQQISDLPVKFCLVQNDFMGLMESRAMPHHFQHGLIVLYSKEIIAPVIQIPKYQTARLRIGFRSKFKHNLYVLPKRIPCNEYRMRIFQLVQNVLIDEPVLIEFSHRPPAPVIRYSPYSPGSRPGQVMIFSSGSV